MLLALNAVLYLTALGLSLWVVTPVPAGANRRYRIARASLAGGGGAAIGAAIVLAFGGLWIESAVVGTVALVVVVICLAVALSQSSAPDRDDGESGSDGGGGRPRRPIPPAPPEPLGGRPVDWSEFDALRAGWARTQPREPAGV